MLPVTAACRRAAPLFVQSDSRMSNRVSRSAGTSPKISAREHRQRHREERDRPCDADAVRARQSVPRSRRSAQEVDAPPGEREAGGAATRVTARGSRRSAAGRFAPRLAPSATRTAISFCRADGARQQQVGDVGARDQEHEQRPRPSSIRSAGRTFWTSCSCARLTSARTSVFESGIPLRAARKSRPSPRAPARCDTPSFNRAIGRMPGCQPRSSGSVAAHGPSGT